MVGVSADMCCRVEPGGPIVMRRTQLHTIFRGAAALVLAFASLSLADAVQATSAGADQVGGGGGSSCVAASNAPLQPDAGQYTPISPVRIVDTTASNGQVVNVAVTGVSGIPSSGISAVTLNISAISPSASGHLTAYEDDIADPGHGVVTFQSGQNANGEDVVSIGADGGIDIGVYGPSSVTITASVRGYFTDGTAVSAGETFVPMTEAEVLDTRTGLGVQNGAIGPLASGQSMPVQLGGTDGLPSGGVDAVAIEIGAIGGATSGDLIDGTTSSLTGIPSVLSYNANEIDRQSDYVSLPSSGTVWIKNGGSGSVGLQVLLEGYFLDPSVPCMGDEEAQVTPGAIPLDSQGDTQLTISANSSVTIQEEGVGQIPASGVASILQEVNVVTPQDTGWLSVYPGGSSDPELSVLNFVGGDNGDESFSNTVPSWVSPTGQVIVSNHSVGTVKLILSPAGYWSEPTTPLAPVVGGSIWSNGQATVNWSVEDDNGSPITSYLITSSSGGSSTVPGNVGDGGVGSVTASQGDSIQVVANNGVGASPPSDPIGAGGQDDSDQVTAATFPVDLGGQVCAPDSTNTCPNSSATEIPPAGTLVTLTPTDIPTGADASVEYQPPTIGTAYTDANGDWSYSIPSFASLPSDAQTDANQTGGWLNVTATAVDVANTSTTSYAVEAIGLTSIFVGSSTIDSIQADPQVDMTLQSATPDTANQMNTDSQVESTTDGFESISGDNDQTTNSLMPQIGTMTGSFGPETTSNYLANVDTGSDGTSLVGLPLTTIQDGSGGCGSEANCFIQACYLQTPPQGDYSVPVSVYRSVGDWEPYPVKVGYWDAGHNQTDQIGASKNHAYSVGGQLSLSAGIWQASGSETVTTGQGITFTQNDFGGIGPTNSSNVDGPAYFWLGGTEYQIGWACDADTIDTTNIAVKDLIPTIWLNEYAMKWDPSYDFAAGQVADCETNQTTACQEWVNRWSSDQIGTNGASKCQGGEWNCDGPQGALIDASWNKHAPHNQALWKLDPQGSVSWNNSYDRSVSATVGITAQFAGVSFTVGTDYSKQNFDTVSENTVSGGSLVGCSSTWHYHGSTDADGFLWAPYGQSLWHSSGSTSALTRIFSC